MSSRNCRTPLLYPLLAVSLYLAATGAAAASTGSEYVTQRQKLHCDRKLTYAEVQADPARYVGRVLELRGIVGGTAESADKMTMMLNLPDNNALALEVPRREGPVVKELMTPALRVLVKIEQGASGNVVPLTVLAVAHESAVSAQEAQEAARVAAVQEAERQRQEREQAARAARNRASAPAASRGGYIRPASNHFTPNNATMQTMITCYQEHLGPRVQSLFVPYFQFVANHNKRLNTQQAGEIAYHLLRFADFYNVDPRLVVAMIIAESDFDPHSTSRTGAMGLGQLMPYTARALGVSDPYNLEQNLQGSVNYLRSRLDTFADRAMPNGGLSFEQVRLAMAAYNAGTNAVKRYHGIPPYRETQAYVKRVESLFRQLCGQ